MLYFIFSGGDCNAAPSTSSTNLLTKTRFDQRHISYSISGSCFAGSTGCGQPGQDAIVEVIPGDTICPPGTFNDKANDRSECLDCFCFGITNQCSSTELYVNKVGQSVFALNHS